MSKILSVVQARKQNYTSLRAAFRSESGAIDLASIMVGIIVIGLIGGVIAATVFAVIPWAQDNAAKQQLDSIHTAENASYGLSADPVITPDQSKRNMFTDSQGLADGQLLAKGATYCVIPTAAGKDYAAYAKSASGKIWTATNSAKTATVFSGTPEGACSTLAASSGGTATPPAVWDTTISMTGFSGAVSSFDASADGSQIIAIVGSVVVRSFDAGVTWAAVVFPSYAVSPVKQVVAMSDNGQVIVVAGVTPETASYGYQYAFFTTDGGAVWGDARENGSITASYGECFADVSADGTFWAASCGTAVQMSTYLRPSATTFTEVANSLTLHSIGTTASQRFVTLGTTGGGVIQYNFAGTKTVITETPNPIKKSVAFSNSSTLFIGYGDGKFTTDTPAVSYAGSTAEWENVTPFSASRIFGILGGKAVETVDGGATWTVLDTDSAVVTDLDVVNGKLYVSTSGSAGKILVKSLI